MAPDLSIVVLSWNTAELLLACLRSLRGDSATGTREIIVVDNASEDGSADRVAAEFPEVRLIRNSKNLLYSEGNNIGARAATGRWLCLLNSDTEVSPGALDRLVAFLREHPEHGMVGPKLVNPDGSVQAGCRRLPTLGEAFWSWGWLRRTRRGLAVEARARMADFDHLSSRDVEQPLGACMMMLREEFLAIGGLDPKLSLFYNDVDLCLQLRQRGRRVHYLVDAVVMHHHGASTKKKREEFGNPLWNANRVSFYRKHHGVLVAAVVWTMLLGSLLSMSLRILLGRRKWAEKREVFGRFRLFAWRSLMGVKV